MARARLSNDEGGAHCVPPAGLAGRVSSDPDAEDTARWILHVNYVLPSENPHVLRAGLWRPTGMIGLSVRDHCLVRIDVVVPQPVEVVVPQL